MFCLPPFVDSGEACVRRALHRRELSIFTTEQRALYICAALCFFVSQADAPVMRDKEIEYERRTEFNNRPSAREIACYCTAPAVSQLAAVLLQPR